MFFRTRRETRVQELDEFVQELDSRRRGGRMPARDLMTAIESFGRLVAVPDLRATHRHFGEPPVADRHAIVRPTRRDFEVAHDVITVRHWGRLLDGALLATSPRVAWAELLRRTHGVT